MIVFERYGYLVEFINWRKHGLPFFHLWNERYVSLGIHNMGIVFCGLYVRRFKHDNAEN